MGHWTLIEGTMSLIEAEPGQVLTSVGSTDCSSNLLLSRRSGVTARSASRSGLGIGGDRNVLARR